MCLCWAAILPALSAQAVAQSAANVGFVEPSPSSTASWEAWVGADATRNSWSLHSGITYAPFGPVSAQGWRIRATAGYGQYRYPAYVSRQHVSIYGTVSFASLLAGYHAQIGALTVKAFAGIDADLHDLAPFDPGNPVNDHGIGARLALETWYELSRAAWASADLAWSSAHEGYSGRLRLGYRLQPELSVGLEAGGFGNAASDSRRAGLFARYEWPGGEISGSGGVSGDIARPTNPYGTLTLLTRF